MKKFFSIFVFMFLTKIPLHAVEYDVDFVIQNAPVATMRAIVFKNYHFPSASLTHEKGSADVGETLLPGERCTIKAHGILPENFADTDQLIELVNNGTQPPKNSHLWQDIVFSVQKREDLPDEEVTLYWAPGYQKIFGAGKNKHISLSVMHYGFKYNEKKKLKKYEVKILFSDQK